MKPLSPKARARLQAANDLVLELLGRGIAPDAVIAVMTVRLGAECRFRSGTNQLVCAGVIGTATCNTSPVLLGSWRRKAMARLLA